MADRKKLIEIFRPEVKKHGYQPERPIVIDTSPDQGAGYQPTNQRTKPAVEPPPKKP